MNYVTISKVVTNADGDEVRVGKDYPVIYGAQSFAYYGKWAGIKLNEMDMVLFQDLPEVDANYMLYAGLLSGADTRSKKLDISFYEFQEAMMQDPNLVESLGTFFADDIQTFVKKTEEKIPKKKEGVSPMPENP